MQVALVLDDGAARVPLADAFGALQERAAVALRCKPGMQVDFLCHLKEHCLSLV